MVLGRCCHLNLLASVLQLSRRTYHRCDNHSIENFFVQRVVVPQILIDPGGIRILLQYLRVRSVDCN